MQNCHVDALRVDKYLADMPHVFLEFLQLELLIGSAIAIRLAIELRLDVPNRRFLSLANVHRDEAKAEE